MATIEEEQLLVATFLEITQSNSAERASHILKVAGWNLDEAAQLYFDGGRREQAVLPSYASLGFEPTGWGFDGEDGVPEPEQKDENIDDETIGLNADAATENLGATNDFPTLSRVVEQINYDSSDFQRSSRLSTRAGDAWEWRGEGSDYTNLTRLFCRPTHLIHKGSFHQTKVVASRNDKWLLVNMQSSKLFDSHQLNRDTWSNSTVEEILHAHFIFWQINHEEEEGMKVCCYYKLESLPAIMVVDPITGEKMYACRGMKQPEDLLEELIKFSDESPKQHHSSIVHRSRRGNAIAEAHSQTGTDEASKPVETSPAPKITKLVYPPLPEEPIEQKLICRVSICLPTGQRAQRSFLKTNSIKFLWSFCSTLLKEEDTRVFCFIVPSSSNKLFYNHDTSFEDAGLCNTLVHLAWED